MRVSFVTVLIFFLFHHSKLLVLANGQSSPPGAFVNNEGHNPNLDKEKKQGQTYSSSWAALATIDPSRILTTLIQNGGMVLDESLEKELKDVARCVHCDVAQLNPFERRMLIHNLTISVPGKPRTEYALRIGRTFLQWDSYLRPCLEIEVEDVDINVDFVNMWLSRTNWHELRDAGFPPKLYDDYWDITKSSTSTTESSTILFGSFNLLGSVVVRARSVPLKKSLCPDIVIDLSHVQELNEQVRQAADNNFQTKGRRGCTSEELQEVYQSFFFQTVKDGIKSTLEDIAKDQMVSNADGMKQPSVTAMEAQRLLSNLQNAAIDYAEGVSKEVQDTVQENIRNEVIKIAQLNPENEGDKRLVEEVDRIVSHTILSLKEGISSSIQNMLKREPQPTETPTSDVEVLPLPDEIQFADW